MFKREDIMTSFLRHFVTTYVTNSEASLLIDVASFRVV